MPHANPELRRGRLLALALGALASLVLLELALRLLGGAFVLVQDWRNRGALRGGEGVTVMCIGESTTAIGQSMSYPSQLEEVLNAWGEQRYQVVNRGVPGADTSILMAQLDRDLDAYQPRVVVAMMGANDNHSGLGGGAIPVDDLPLAERTGVLSSLKTWRLARQVMFQLHRRDAPRTVPLAGYVLRSVRRWRQESPCARSAEAVACPEVAAAWDEAEAGDLARARVLLEGLEHEHPGDRGIMAELGAFELLTGDPERGRRWLEDASKGGLPSADLLLGSWLADRRRPADAARLLARVVRAWPDDAWAHMRLGFALRMSDRCVEAIPHLERATVLDPSSPYAYEHLGACWARLGRADQAVPAYERAVERYPADAWYDAALVGLEQILVPQRRFDELEQLYLRSIERRPQDDALRARLASIYQRAGDPERARATFAEAARIRESNYCPMTRSSYARLLAASHDRGFLLVASQYPMRAVDILRAQLPDTEGVVVVDNEGVFRQAQARVGYDALFMDHCYGDFGHGTALGNRVLAESVADAILDALGDDSLPRERTRLDASAVRAAPGPPR